MSVKARTFLSFLLVAACLVLARPSAYAQGDPAGVDSTHYWTYHLIDPFYQLRQVYVKDQFFTNYTFNYTDSLLRLVNWVYKNNSTVRDTFLHYTWWNLQYKLAMNQYVKVTNQFGQYYVNTYYLDFLLAPAWKQQMPIPGGPYANHYLCYKANGFPPPTPTYHFRDEWRTDDLPVGPLEFLCVPCWKQHAGQTYAPPDTVTHLALYRILPYSIYNFYPFIQDQFVAGTRGVRQFPIEYLLVPSLKNAQPTETKKSTWGRFKTIYR